MRVQYFNVNNACMFEAINLIAHYDKSVQALRIMHNPSTRRIFTCSTTQRSKKKKAINEPPPLTPPPPTRDWPGVSV